MTFFVRRLCDSGSREKHCFSRFDPCGKSKSKSKSVLTKDVYAPFPERKHKVVGYCRGLFCLEYDNGEILIWNPSMNEFKLLPPSNLAPTPPPPCPCPNCDGNCTVSVVSVVRGLGFDPRSKDYKVVKFLANYYHHYKEYDHGLSKRVEVYSLKNDCWKGIDSNEESSAYEIVDECATYVNGFCYWIAHSNLMYPFHGLRIVSFDLARETFTIIHLPKCRPSHRGGISYELGHCSILLTPVMETLAAVAHHLTSERVDKVLQPWVRRGRHGHGQRWTRKCRMASGVLVRAERPLGYSRNGKVLLLEGFDGKLLLYDSAAKQLKKIDQIYDHPHSMQLFRYAESFVSLTEQKDANIKRKRKRKRGSRS